LAIDAICNHWAIRKERKIYIFGMGTDFKKLKYPSLTLAIWQIFSRIAD